MLVYIAGPMTGHKDYNKEAFTMAAVHLRIKGYQVYSPWEEDSYRYLEGNMSKGEMITKQLQKVVEADAIYLLPGWQNSVGTRQELRLALMLDKEILVGTLEDLKPL